MTAMELFEVGPGVWQLPLPIAWENGSVNCFLLPRGDQVDLIDCGMSAEESFALIRAAVAELAGPRGRLRWLVVTHIHPDHYGGAGEMTERDGAVLFLHRLEVPMVHPRYLEIDQLVEEVGRYLQVHGVPEAEVEGMKNASRGMRDWVRPATRPCSSTVRRPSRWGAGGCGSSGRQDTPRATCASSTWRAASCSRATPCSRT
jgi:hypothetical protein